MDLARKKIIGWILSIHPAALASFLAKVIAPKRIITPTPHGDFYINEVSFFGHELLSSGIYESWLVDTLHKYLAPGGVFIDLGAHEGYFSVIASRIVGESGRVIAVEPQSRIQGIIARNLALNQSHNVTVLPVAISDKSGPVSLYLAQDVNSGASSLFKRNSFPFPVQKTEALTLLDVFRNEKIDRCDLIKIDIEGAEQEAIMGSRELFEEKRIKAIALDFHPRVLKARGISGETLLDFLTGCGFRLCEDCYKNTIFVC